MKSTPMIGVLTWMSRSVQRSIWKQVYRSKGRGRGKRIKWQRR